MVVTLGGITGTKYQESGWKCLRIASRIGLLLRNIPTDVYQRIWEAYQVIGIPGGLVIVWVSTVIENSDQYGSALA